MSKSDRMITEAAALLGILANPKRLQMLMLLVRDGEKSVGALGEQVELSQSAISQHLSKLRQAGVVSTRRDAQTVYYSSRHDGVTKVLACLEDIYHLQALSESI
jgi:ArsR family transcriptional regulator, virulence genes transcriptional regulator